MAPPPYVTDYSIQATRLDKLTHFSLQCNPRGSNAPGDTKSAKIILEEPARVLFLCPVIQKDDPFSASHRGASFNSTLSTSSYQPSIIPTYRKESAKPLNSKSTPSNMSSRFREVMGVNLCMINTIIPAMAKVYDEHQLLSLAQKDPSLHAHIVDHPLVRDALRVMRDKNTTQVEFRTAVHMLAPHLIYAATSDLREVETKIETPLAPMTTSHIKDTVVLIPILRSGIGMHVPAQTIFPSAPTIFAGMARDEATAIPHWYYDLKHLEYLNKGDGVVFLILDPMLATGGSAVETVKQIKEIYPKGKIKMISMIAAPEGIRVLNKAYPDVAITVGAVDDHLNEKAYIVPGLGDAGDRQFGTL